MIDKNKLHEVGFREVKYCEWCSKKTYMEKTTQSNTPILEFIEDKIDLIGREEIWGIHGDWSEMNIDSDLEAELLIYDEMLSTMGKRIVCITCLKQDELMYKKYYSGMIGEDIDDYIIELE